MAYKYESRIVNKPRTYSWCANEDCNKELPPGKSRVSITYHDSEFLNATVCNNDKCENEWEKQQNFDE